jgi:hypothetical protein
MFTPTYSFIWCTVSDLPYFLSFLTPGLTVLILVRFAKLSCKNESINSSLIFCPSLKHMTNQDLLNGFSWNRMVSLIKNCRPLTILFKTWQCRMQYMTTYMRFWLWIERNSLNIYGSPEYLESNCWRESRQRCFIITTKIFHKSHYFRNNPWSYTRN